MGHFVTVNYEKLTILKMTATLHQVIKEQKALVWYIKEINANVTPWEENNIKHLSYKTIVIKLNTYMGKTKTKTER